MNINEKISKELQIEKWQVINTRSLIEDGKTLPFIARYRKEITGGLTEVQLRKFFDLLDHYKRLKQRKEEIIKSIQEQGKLTKELENKILKCEKLVELEDIYLPYKRKKKTKADIAKENGLQKLADFFKSSRKEDPNYIQNFTNEKFPTIQDVIDGAKDIISQEINENIEIRNLLREEVIRNGILVSRKSKTEDPKQTYKDYYEYKVKFSRLKPYQVLALKRGSKQKILNLHLEFEESPLYNVLKKLQFNSNLSYFDFLIEATENAINNYLTPSLFNESFSDKIKEAQKRSAEIFARNLRNLMLQKPLNKKRIIAIDPGYRTGCKFVILNEYGDLLDHGIIYPNQPHSKTEESQETIIRLVENYNIDYIIIGNKTASQETRKFVAKTIKQYTLKVKYAMVSEDGASVYSASKTAVEELPQYDVTTRGAISIGRRVQDPMAELVKIPPASIGIGMYQHDLPSKLINFTLEREVESVVNHVGVNLNTASKHLLKYISGLNSKMAENIVKYRQEHGPFRSRKELLKVPSIGPKAYEQAAGFCRIPDSPNPLDNTIIHPEKYDTANKVLDYFNTDIENFSKNIDIKNINYNKTSNDLKISIIELKDIIEGLLSKNVDPRENMPQINFTNKIINMEDLNIGDIVQGTVTNVVDFGAFVDIGIKNSGLVHKSNISKKYIQDPSEVLKVGQILNFRIISIDKDRGRIGLSLKDI